MEQQNENTYDILLAFITLIVSVLPGILLLISLFVIYLIIKKIASKVLDKNFKRLGLIFNSIALVLVLIALYTCIDLVFWPTFNTAVPLIIVSLLFNRSAQKLYLTKKFTSFIYILTLLVIFYAIISYLFNY